MLRRTARSALAPAVPLALALALAGCADCGGGGGDAGPDAAQQDDAGSQCEYLGGDCAQDGDCCGTLVCLDQGVCGNPPGCEDNDDFAGTPTAPADLEGLGDDTPLACQGFPFLDVFTVEAAAGEILLLTLETEGLAPHTRVEEGQPDIDFYLLSGPPTGVSQGAVEGPIVAAGATLSSTELMAFDVVEGGTFYVAVTLYSGPDGAYSLELERRTGCAFDADCGVDEFCQVAVEPDHLVVLQQCAVWTAPGCGNGEDEAGGDVHGDSDAVELTGAVDGLSCAGDIDVFRFERAYEERSFLTLSAEGLGDDLLVASIVDEAGVLLQVVTLDEALGSLDYAFGVGSPAGTYYVYVEQFGADGGEGSYTIALDRQPACRTDEDCADGRSCGVEVFAGGPTQVCVVPSDPCSDDDSDNSRGAATSLTPSADVSSEVCMGGQDLYEIVLEQPVSDVVITLDWAGRPDLDLYVYAEDGTQLGAGWYGNGGEVWEGVALPAQRLYAWVDVFACDFDADDNPISCADLIEYTVTVEQNPATVCAADADCFVGGVSANDPATNLACRAIDVDVDNDDVDAGPSDADAGDDDGGEPDAGEPDAGDDSDGGAASTSVQACVRPVEPGLLDRAGGQGCFDPYDCSTLLCLDGYCTTTCEGGQSDCDATLGDDAGYCFELTQTPLCLLACASDADCDRVFGADAQLTCTEGACVQ